MGLLQQVLSLSLPPSFHSFFVSTFSNHDYVLIRKKRPFLSKFSDPIHWPPAPNCGTDVRLLRGLVLGDVVSI